MKILNLQTAPKVPFDLDAYIMHSDQEIELVHLSLKPGEKIDLHKNPFDVIFYVLDGVGELQIEENTYTLSQYNTVRIDKTADRAWFNNSKENFIVLVIKLLEAK